LKSLIQAQPSGQPAVITVAPGSPDDGYGLLVVPPADFAQQLHLDDPTKLENPYFKIVEAESSEPLSFSDFDGDNVLYHLMKGRAYYAALAKNGGFEDAVFDSVVPRKLIVRVRMKNASNPATHFSASADYDNSYYVPAQAPMIHLVLEQRKSMLKTFFGQLSQDLGCTSSTDPGAKWQLQCAQVCDDLASKFSSSATEKQMQSDGIPFAGVVQEISASLSSPVSCSAKEAAISSAFAKADALVDVQPWSQEIFFDIRKVMRGKIDWYDLISSAGLSVATGSWVSLGATPMQFFDNYNAGIDGEKIPDVIYHEAFHYASDAEGLFPMASEGNPVAEDYANYFGSSLNGRPEIAEIDEFSGSYYKRDYSKIVEVKDGTPEPYNANPFGAAVFWQIRNSLGQARADQLIWNSLHYLDGSALHGDVPQAVSEAAHADSDLSADEIASIDHLLKTYRQSYINLELKFGQGSAGHLDLDALKKAASDEAEQIKNIPAELQALGIAIDADTATHIASTADSLKSESLKPGFRSRVVHAMEDLGKALGYAGGAVYAGGNAPMDFGTDFFSSLFSGHGLLTGKDRSTEAELTGSTGGVVATYYLYSGLSALGYAFSGTVTSSAFGVVFINSEVCKKADPSGKSSLDVYCLKNAQLLNVIQRDSVRSGAEIGTAVHQELKKIGQFLKKLFS
jgi:hypothetical protein